MKPCLNHRMQQRKENRSKGRLTVRRHLGRSRGQTAKRWMKTHKCVWRQNECLCIWGVASINTKKRRPIPSRRIHLTTLRCSEWGRCSLLLTVQRMCDRVSCWRLNSRKQSCWQGANSRCVFYLCWLFPVRECNCVYVCVYLYIGVRCFIWPEWLVEQKTCLSRRSKLSMDSTVARHDMRKKKDNPKNKGSSNWCMTCSLQTPGETVLICEDVVLLPF